MKPSINLLFALSVILSTSAYAQSWEQQQQMYNQKSNLEAELFIQREEMEQQQRENERIMEDQREAIQDQQQAIDQQRRELETLSDKQDQYSDY